VSVSINTPGSVGKVKNPSVICVEGDASSGGAGPQVVKAKVYQGSVPIQDLPSEPPADATTGTVNGETFAFEAVSGATCSDNEPYPNNTVAVWARFIGPPMFWELDSNVFGGQCSTKTDCEP
jgi:hypothetical protein